MNSGIGRRLIWLLAPVCLGGLILFGISYTAPNVQTTPYTAPNTVTVQPPTMMTTSGVLQATGGYRRFAEHACRWCGTGKDLQVHHIIPQHIILQQYAAGKLTLKQAKDLLDNDPTNFVTFCPRCHLVVGHKCDWHNDVTNLTAILEAGKD